PVQGRSFWQGKCVLITGASSGIGEALAVELARLGARVGLFARRADRLKRLAARIEHDGGSALVLPGDVAIRQDVHRAVEQMVAHWQTVDVLIANAGRGMHGAAETDAEVVRQVYSVNFLGAVNALEAVLPWMRRQGRGHVAAISSGTALLPKLAASPTYASSKMAMGRYFEGLGRELRAEGIIVTVVYPGFVRTEMTSGHKWMPFALEPDEAAFLIRRGIERGRRRVIFPRRTLWLGRIAQLAPLKVQLAGRQRYSGTPRKSP
ncbi:MAG TPA: SDR family NAD(P)-dependent oxidoreductase, partial [Limnochordia bacterium]|nr:SDR family NAD(P)-dependent oxidoreductase [Limnochordia bacterium]